MYYVIKQQHDSPLNHFTSFLVEKYIASKNTEHVIFEFQKDGKSDRKWIEKKDIILLTDDKNFFIEILNNFKDAQNYQQELVKQAKEQLELSIKNFSSVMHEEIDKFNEVKSSANVPCLLKDF